jgi:hypothetical protein
METPTDRTDELPVTQVPATLPRAHIGHISLTAQHPTALADFYQATVCPPPAMSCGPLGRRERLGSGSRPRLTHTKRLKPGQHLQRQRAFPSIARRHFVAESPPPLPGSSTLARPACGVGKRLRWSGRWELKQAAEARPRRSPRRRTSARDQRREHPRRSELYMQLCHLGGALRALAP